MKIGQYLSELSTKISVSVQQSYIKLFDAALKVLEVF